MASDRKKPLGFFSHVISFIQPGSLQLRDPAHACNDEFLMPIEIERKFLVANDGWRASVTGIEKLRDGLVGAMDGAKVRVRIGQNNASLTVKSRLSE